MLKYLTIICFFPFAAKAQCLWGDCKNGRGKMDFGYAVYTGEFKNGLQQGQGTMDYGNGDKYAGYWNKGKEDGVGLLFVKGIAKPVEYINGQVKEKKWDPIVIGNAGYTDKPQQFNLGCDSGDCVNGYGKMRFPSGNKYKGNFKNYQFNGHGVMTFASGNELDANFKDHVPQDGSFFYANEGVTFKGSFNEDGTPRSGIYKNEAETEVTVENGKITKVYNPKVEEAKKAEEEKNKKQYMRCTACHGKGYYAGSSFSYSTVGGIGHRDGSGYVSWDIPSSTVGHQSFSFGLCSSCHGTGMMEISPYLIAVMDAVFRKRH